MIELDQALQKLNQLDERLVQIVELRFFAELGFEETAGNFGQFIAKSETEYSIARRLLYHE